jgi:hypothetical protein
MTDGREPTQRAPEDRPGRFGRRLLSCWPVLRVLLQLGTAGAMLSQQEGIALTISGIATSLEMLQDHFSRATRRG